MRSVDDELEVWRVLLGALSSRLAGVLPPGFSAQVKASTWEVAIDQQRVAGIPLDALIGGDFVGSLEQILAGVQDIVIQRVGHGWPGVKHSPGRDLPMPNVVAENEALHVFFGDSDRPELDVGWINLDSLGLQSSDDEIELKSAGPPE